MSDPCDLLQLFQLCRRRYAAALHPVERTWGLTRNEIDVILFLSNHPGWTPPGTSWRCAPCPNPTSANQWTV